MSMASPYPQGPDQYPSGAYAAPFFDTWGTADGYEGANIEVVSSSPFGSGQTPPMPSPTTSPSPFANADFAPHPHPPPRQPPPMPVPTPARPPIRSTKPPFPTPAREGPLDFLPPEPVQGGTYSEFPMTLSWRDMSYSVRIKNKCCCRGGGGEEKTIISNHTGSARPGRVMVIMGPSGAGKTTFLNALADRVSQAGGNKLSGAKYINQLPYSSEFGKVLSFVTQEDVIFQTATPKESLTFAASVKTPSGANKKELVQTRTEKTIAKLHLEKCQNTVVGVPGVSRGVSGGERKRTNIGVDLVTNPRLIFLDEPTSGLDSAYAFEVVHLMKNLAVEHGATVICTLHQPSSQIMDMVDDVMLLADGRTVYHGPTRQLVPYLSQQGHHCPEHYNPADFAMEAMSIDKEGLIQAWAGRRDALMQHPSFSHSLSSAMDQPHPPGVHYIDADSTKREVSTFLESISSSFGAQLSSNFGRSWRNYLRNKNLLKVRLMQALVFGAIMGFLFFQIDYDQSGVRDKVGLGFLVVVNTGMGSMSSGLASFPPERAVYIREQRAGFYSPLAFLLGKTLTEIPFNIIFPSIFSAIVYWLAGWRSEVDAFVLFTLSLVLISLAMSSVGMVIGTLIPDPQAANAAAPALLMPLIIVTGLLVSTERLSPWLIWLQYLSPFRYCNISNLIGEFKGRGLVACDQEHCPFKDGDQVLDYYGFDVNRTLMLAVMVGLVVLYRILAGLALWKVGRTL